MPGPSSSEVYVFIVVTPFLGCAHLKPPCINPEPVTQSTDHHHLLGAAVGKMAGGRRLCSA